MECSLGQQPAREHAAALVQPVRRTGSPGRSTATAVLVATSADIGVAGGWKLPGSPPYSRGEPRHATSTGTRRPSCLASGPARAARSAGLAASLPEVVALVPPIPPYVKVLKIARVCTFCAVRGMPSTGMTNLSRMRLCAWIPVSRVPRRVGGREARAVYRRSTVDGAPGEWVAAAARKIIRSAVFLVLIGLAHAGVADRPARVADPPVRVAAARRSDRGDLDRVHVDVAASGTARSPT